MAQKHLDRLSAVDASFLHQEGDTSHMHIGAVVVLEGPGPSYEDFLAHIGGRLHLVPRYRQKIIEAPYQTARPLWIDDPSFNLEYHVRHTALPGPGTHDQLMRLAARIASQRLDRTKPLWELWLVEGLEGGNAAIISKTHHALVDGVSGAELLTVLFDITPEPRPVTPDPWMPDPEPGKARLLLEGVRDLAGKVTGIASQVMADAQTPSTLLHQAREAAEGLGEVAWAILNPAPPTPLNGPIGPHRRFAVVDARLADFKEIKNALGGTVNDVLLCVVAGAVARFLRGRGVRTEGLELRACVPVSQRSADQRGALGNRITIMLAPLPVHIDDPVARLGAVRTAMDGLKESKQALGANVIASMQSFAPPTILAQASRLGMSSRMYNLLVTNVPGPQFPVYCLGSRLLDLYPIAFLAPDHALAVAIMSYDGHINFGLLGDYDTLPDMDVVTQGIEDALAELLQIVRATEPPRRSRGRRRPAAHNGHAAAATTADAKPVARTAD